MLVKSASITAALISHLTSFLTLALFTDLFHPVQARARWFITAYGTVMFTQCKEYILTI